MINFLNYLNMTWQEILFLSLMAITLLLFFTWLGSNLTFVKPKSKEESPMEKIHWMIHEADCKLVNGDIVGAREILVKADLLAHDNC